jgi:hypothetical protein
LPVEPLVLPELVLELVVLLSPDLLEPTSLSGSVGHKPFSCSPLDEMF